MRRSSFPLACVLVLTACPSPTPAPTLTSVEPETLLAREGGHVTLRGAGWLPAGAFDFDSPSRSTWTTSVTVTMTSADGSTVVLLSGPAWADASRVEGDVPAGLPAGRYLVTLTTPRNETLELPDALELTEELPREEPDAGLVVVCTTLTLADSDGDGFGNPDSGALLCGPGRVDAGGDCNDVDALTSPAGFERCNGIDDDCNGTIDDGVCTPDAGGPVFTRIRTLDDSDNDFVAVSAFGPDAVWIAGNDKLFVHLPDSGFSDRSDNCPPRMNAVWADPSGRAFVAGGNPGIGRIALANPRSGGQGGCSRSEMLPDPVAGLSGFVGTDGGVWVEALLRDGRHARWDGVTNPVITGTPAGMTLTHAQASASGRFFGVGSTMGAPAVVRERTATTLVVEDLTALTPLTAFRGVWSTSPFQAVAVGDDGGVVRREAGRWERITPAVTTNLTAVRAFAAGRFYLSTERGTVQLWNGSWTVYPTDPLPIRAIDGVDEEHLWLVGDNGFILRGP